MKILFCADPLDSKIVDQEYEQEYHCARKLGIDVYLISLESLLDGEMSKAVKHIPTFEVAEAFVYRGWMLKPHDYEQLYHALQQKNALLINSPTQYITGHYFPHSYEAIRTATPRSIWVGIDELSGGFDALFEKMRIFQNQPVIVKDYVKSRKHEWEEACYIPDASDLPQVTVVLRNFIDRQGSELSGGIVIREFIPLEQLAHHPKSGMPLSNEYRLFFLHQELIQCVAYWDEVEDQQEMPDLNSFIAIAQGIASSFFTMDIAKMANGDWTIIEVGDGQVSGLPIHANMEKFYTSLM